MQNKSGKTAVFSRDATLWNVKEVPPSALNERQKNPEMAAFPGFFYMEVQDV